MEETDLVITITHEPTQAQKEQIERFVNEYVSQNQNAKVYVGAPRPRPRP